jgi:hypothetical protein
MGLPNADWIAFAVFMMVAMPTAWWELRTPALLRPAGLAASGALSRTYLRQALTVLGVCTVM